MVDSVFAKSHPVFFRRDVSVICRIIVLKLAITSVLSKLHSTTRPFAQCCLIVAHFQHSKLNTASIHRIALLTLGTFHCLYVCMVAQLHRLSAQLSKHLLGVEVSQRGTLAITVFLNLPFRTS